MFTRFAGILAVLALAACAQGGGAVPVSSNGHRVTGLNGVQGEVKGTVLPGSKFSRLQIGMGSKEAESIAGSPDDTATHITGKQFIPFYFGGDGFRRESFYRGQGQLTYTHSSFGTTQLVLIGITVDPSERGFAH